MMAAEAARVGATVADEYSRYGTVWAARGRRAINYRYGTVQSYVHSVRASACSALTAGEVGEVRGTVLSDCTSTRRSTSPIRYDYGTLLYVCTP